MTDSSQTQDTFFRKYRLGLMVLVLAIIVAGVAMYITLLPSAPPMTNADRPFSESDQVRLEARELLAANKPKLAVEMLKQFIQTHPQDIDTRMFLAELQLRLRDIDGSEATVKDILTIAPEHSPTLWMQGVQASLRGKDPEPFFQQAVESPKVTPDIWGMYGMYLLQKEKKDQAKNYLQKAVAAGTQRGMIYAALGQIAFQDNQLNEAERLLNKATELTPNSVPAWAILSEVQKNLGHAKASVQSLQRALQVAGGPERGAILRELGTTEMVRKNWTAAASYFAQAGDYPSVGLDAKIKAAQCFYFAKDYAQAMQYIDQAHQVAPANQTVLRWKTKIENARFGTSSSQSTTTQTTRSLLEVPPEEKQLLQEEEQEEESDAVDPLVP